MSKRKRTLLGSIGAALFAGLVWAASVFTGHPMTGTGTAPPTAKWYPASSDFGVVEVGQFVDRTVRLKNVGKGGNLTGTVSVSTDCPAGVYTITNGGGPYTLAPGQSRNVTIRFAPQDTTGAVGCILQSGP